MKTWLLFLFGVPLSIAAGVAAAIYFCQIDVKMGKEIASGTPTAVDMAGKFHRVMDGRSLVQNNGSDHSWRFKRIRKKRKIERGLGKLPYIIAVPGETISVGGREIEMDDISEKIRFEIGDIVETDLKTGEMASKKSDAFGIHILKARDHLPNIHFQILKELANSRGISLSRMPGEPESGPGLMAEKILTFSEDNVYIYDIKKKKLTSDANLLEANSKIVIHRLERALALLDSMDDRLIDGGLVHYEKSGVKLYFDGDALWMKTGGAGQKTGRGRGK